MTVPAWIEVFSDPDTPYEAIVSFHPDRGVEAFVFASVLDGDELDSEEVRVECDALARRIVDAVLEAMIPPAARKTLRRDRTSPEP